MEVKAHEAFWQPVTQFDLCNQLSLETATSEKLKTIAQSASISIAHISKA
jgi:hypothetical protein